MAIVSELIREESDGSISFGDYSLAAKSKKDDFKHEGDLYKVKTFKEITKLERNGAFVYESVPGTAVNSLKLSENGVSFLVEGFEDAQVTLELEPETEYDIKVDGNNAGTMKTNLSGKLSLSVEIDEGKLIPVEVTRL
jgi:hypothetical protein